MNWSEYEDDVLKAGYESPNRFRNRRNFGEDIGSGTRSCFRARDRQGEIIRAGGIRI